MLTVVFMVTKENICRIYTKGSVKEKIVHYKKNHQNANRNGGNEGSKSYKTYRKPILKWQRFGCSLSVITLAISGLNFHKEAEIGRTD